MGTIMKDYHMVHKVYVKVKIEVNIEGKMKPILITWNDGRQYEVDKITDVRRAASMSTGGTGMRYTCIIRGKPAFLFYEDPQWFMEGK
jgi:hypothetical protein